MMSSSTRIRNALEEVAALRSEVAANPALRVATDTVKGYQSRRFAGSYADMLADPVLGPPARFFLDELYSDKDFSSRDGQFHRIANTLERLFPSSVVNTAVSLAELHALSERLDRDMALAWLTANPPHRSDSYKYVLAWRTVGADSDRVKQLEAVVSLANQLQKLTRARSLGTMLKLMRGPASAAGLQDLQRFLERGFETFFHLCSTPGACQLFLSVIQERETELMRCLFNGDLVACVTRLDEILGLAR